MYSCQHVGISFNLYVTATLSLSLFHLSLYISRFWGMLDYLANTLIFILVGIVIAEHAFAGVEVQDWIFLVSLYFGIMVIR